MKTKYFCLVAAILSMRVLAAEPPAGAPESTALRWDADSREYALKPGETTAPFTFVVTNVSNADVTITRLHATCGCTAAKLPSMPYTLGAGSNVAINVEMQLAGKFGLIQKSVMVETSAGAKSLVVRANIPTEPKTTENK
jgi:hypothetical protein